MVDVSAEVLERGRSTIAKNLERQVKKGALPGDAPEQILQRIQVSTDPDEAASRASLVVEAATESPELKYK